MEVERATNMPQPMPSSLAAPLIDDGPPNVAVFSAVTQVNSEVEPLTNRRYDRFMLSFAKVAVRFAVCQSSGRVRGARDARSRISAQVAAWFAHCGATNTLLPNHQLLGA